MMRCSAHVSGQASHASLLAFSIAAVKASEIEFPRWVHKASNGGSVSPKDHWQSATCKVFQHETLIWTRPIFQEAWGNVAFALELGKCLLATKREEHAYLVEVASNVLSIPLNLRGVCRGSCHKRCFCNNINNVLFSMGVTCLDELIFLFLNAIYSFFPVRKSNWTPQQSHRHWNCKRECSHISIYFQDVSPPVWRSTTLWWVLMLSSIFF